MPSDTQVISDDRAKAERIKALLKDRIVRGELAPNAKLPSGRQLGQSLGVSRLTVGKAVSQLLHEGYLYRTKARGSVYVSDGAGRIQQCNTLAVLFPPRIARGTENPFFHWAFLGIEDYAGDRGFSVIVGRVGPTDHEHGALRGLTPGKIDGVLVCGALDHAHQAEAIRSLGRPVVMVSGCGPDYGFTSVMADDERTAQQLVEHLIELGHRRIVFLRGPMEDGDTRHRGYFSALRGAGMEAEASLSIVAPSMDAEVGQAMAPRVLEHPARPTAVFCMNDSLAVGLIAAFRERGVRVPQDISVAGFDDSGIAARTFPPIQLTTGHIPIRQMGQVATEYLIHLISRSACGDPPSPPVKLLVPTELRIRQTTGPARTEGA